VSTTLRFFRFASPAAFYPLAGKLVPWFAAIAAILAAIGLYLGMLRAPTDATQGDSYRIIFIHVPAAWMSMLLYLVMAFWAAIGWAFNARLASIVARAIAPTGAMFTFLALWTGALWGKPTWGAWWVWDARLTSELILLFLYLGYMGLRSAFDEVQRADRVSAVLAVVGVVNVPIIHYSVVWWNSLHQAPSVMRLGEPTMPPSMLVPLLMMLLGFTLFFGALLLVRLRGEVLSRERSASWIREALHP
jgi:heme exporter protein C